MTVESDRQACVFDELSQAASSSDLSPGQRVARYGLITLAGSLAASVAAASVMASVSVQDLDRAWLPVLALGSVFGMVRAGRAGSTRPPANQKTRKPSGDAESTSMFNDTDIITHELESAIYAIQRLVSVGEFSNPTETQKRVLKGIRSESEYLRTLVQDLQSISDLNRSVFEMQPRDIDLSSLLTPAIHTVQAVSTEHNVELVIEHQTSVYADPDRIGQVIRNLLFNAAKYSPPNTTILVRASATGNRTRIEVIDEGLGVGPEDRDRIFKRYDRGGDLRKLAVDGVGLGLYISQCITRLHGSRLRVSSVPGGGSAFSFSLETVT